MLDKAGKVLAEREPPEEELAERMTPEEIELATAEDEPEITEEPQPDEPKAEVVEEPAPEEKAEPTELKPDMTFEDLLSYVKAKKKTEGWLFKNVGMTVTEAQADPYSAAITIKELAGW